MLAFGLVEDADPDEWWSGVAVNLRAPMEWCHHVLPEMVERGRGRIINVTSAAAVITITSGSAYCASKAALSAFTRVLNAEVRSKGVLAFACSPHLQTDMTDFVQASPLVPRSFRQPVPPQIRDAQRQRTADLFRRVLAGELDHHAGEHLDSESMSPA